MMNSLPRFVLFLAILVNCGWNEGTRNTLHQHHIRCGYHTDTDYGGVVADCSNLNLNNVLPLHSKTITSYILDHNHINQLKNDIFQNLPNLRHLSLIDSKVNFVDVHAFRGLPFLDYLELQDNTALRFSGDVFVPLCDLRILGLRGTLGWSTNASENIFSNLINLESLTLDSTALKDFRFNVSKTLKMLDLGFNELKSMPSYAMNNLPNLEQLRLGHNQITSLKLEFNLSSRSSFVLELGSNKLTKIASDDLFGYRRIDLFSMKLYSNRISSIAKDAFRHFKSLGAIRLEYNRPLGLPGVASLLASLIGVRVGVLGLRGVGINVIAFPKDFLEPLSNSSLGQLDLALNTIRTVTHNDMRHLRSLEYLDMSLCHMSSLDSDSFHTSTKLKILILESNRFTDRNSLGNIINHLPNSLEELYAQGIDSTIVSIEANRVPNLKIMDLSNNYMIGKKLDFQGLANLQSLRMNNIIYDLHRSLFNMSLIILNNPSNLSSFGFHKNSVKIKKQDVDWFQKLTELTYIDMSYNDFSLCGMATLTSLFIKMTKLETLNLEACLLRYFPSEIFAKLHKLEAVNLMKNNIHNVEAFSYPLKVSVLTLSLAENNIQQVANGVFKNWTHLQRIDITDNDFVCSCDLRGFRDWLLFNSVIVTGMKERCSKPDTRKTSFVSSFQTSWLECDYHLDIVIGAGSFGGLLILAITISLGFRYYIDLKLWFLIRKIRHGDYARIDGENRLYDAFVSYNSENRAWVKDSLLPNIEECQDVKFRLCIADRDFTPGQLITVNIYDSMQASNCLLFLVTVAFLESEWCQIELEHAEIKLIEDHKSSIILVFLEKIPTKNLPKRMSRLMRHVTYLEWDASHRKQELFWQKMKIALIKGRSQ